MSKKNSTNTPKGSRPKSASNSRKNDDRKHSKKKEHKSAHSEYHCLDDVCILVRVPSSSTFVSRFSNIEGSTKAVSDESLEAYAKQAEERAKQAEERAKQAEERAKQTGTVTGSSASSESFNSAEYANDDDQFYYNMHSHSNSQNSSGGSDLGFLSPEDCSEFMDPVSFAKELVKNVVSESEANVAAMTPSSPQDTEEEVKEGSIDFGRGFRESADYAYIETKRSFTSWPTIENFTVETGAYKIDEYLASFETEEDWMYVIYYQGTQEAPCSDLYRYQAIFSLPTWRYPIAQATASIYFTFEVCKVKPPHCLVDVTYKYETFGHYRKPGDLDFEEKWLHYILDSKITLFKTVTY